MSWADLDWPDLAPDFPEPQPITPPPLRPETPPDIAAQVERAERRRGRGVKLSVVVGAALGLLGIVLAARSPGQVASPLALSILGMALVITFPLAALLALWLGPNWQQRQQHWRLLHWQSERERWLAHERSYYLATLPPALRTRCQQALDAAGGLLSDER